MLILVPFSIAGCSNTNSSTAQTNDLFNFESSPDDTNELVSMILEVVRAPQPFRGNDGLVHLVYEVQIQNFTTETLTLENLTVFGDSTATPPLLMLEDAEFMDRTLLLHTTRLKKPLWKMQSSVRSEAARQLSYIWTLQ